MTTASDLELPLADPVLYWQAGWKRRAVLGLEWPETKAVLKRVLVSYRQSYALESLVSSRLWERDGGRWLRTRTGHLVGVVRPSLVSSPEEGTEPVLIARLERGRLSNAVVAASFELGFAHVRSLHGPQGTLAGQWCHFRGEIGESRDDLRWLESFEKPEQSHARTELELAVRFAIAEDRRERGGL